MGGSRREAQTAALFGVVVLLWMSVYVCLWNWMDGWFECYCCCCTHTCTRSTNNADTHSNPFIHTALLTLPRTQPHMLNRTRTNTRTHTRIHTHTSIAPNVSIRTRKLYTTTSCLSTQNTAATVRENHQWRRRCFGSSRFSIRHRQLHRCKWRTHTHTYTNSSSQSAAFRSGLRWARWCGGNLRLRKCCNSRDTRTTTTTKTDAKPKRNAKGTVVFEAVLPKHDQHYMSNCVL